MLLCECFWCFFLGYLLDIIHIFWGVESDEFCGVGCGVLGWCVVFEEFDFAVMIWMTMTAILITDALGFQTPYVEVFGPQTYLKHPKTPSQEVFKEA